MRRIAKALLLGILLIALSALLAGALFWHQFKHDQGIERFDWQGLNLGFNNLGADRLDLVLHNTGGTLRLSARDFRLDWRLDWRTVGGFHLQALQLNQLTADWQPQPGETERGSSVPPLSRPDPRELLPGWLPCELRVERLELTLPCPAGSCQLTGRLDLQHGGSPAAPAGLELMLLHDSRALQLSARVSGPPEQVDLAARLQIDDRTRLTLASIYREQPASSSWSGHLELPALPEASWLLAWIEQWSGPQPRLQGAADLRLTADWDWQLAPGPLDASQLRALSGHINLDGNLPAAWPLPGVGQLHGSAAVQLRAAAGRWSANRLQADLTLEQLEPALLAALPEGPHPTDIHLQLQQGDASAEQPGALPLQLQLATTGALQLDTEAQVRLNPVPEGWWLQLDSSRIRASAARLQLPGVDGRALRVDLQLTGRLDADGFAFTLDKASSLAAGELLIDSGTEPARLKGLQLDRAALNISGPLPGSGPLIFTLSGPARLRAEQILHPAVRPLSWSWEGQLQADQDRQQLTGTLGNGAGLAGALELARTAETLDISAKLPESFLRSGNPLAATVAAWPALLELNNGRMQLDARLSLPAAGALQVQAGARLKGVAGLYDRSEFSGLDAQLNLQLAADQLRLAIAGLQLQQINPGIPLGPLRFDGEYSAALAQLARGQLNWRTARSGLLGGDIWLEPASLRLGQETLLPVQIRGLQLQELFRVYPAEGLSGHGTLDGELPLSIGPAGVRIVDGRLAARAPGGQLQFNSPKITALGRSNPAMQLVADALADFRYDLLSSGVDYDAQGTLRLALRLEGRNPDIERGRPINFSINLEEDIPALLTSLQLTGRVSERVRERVQQHMEQSRPTP